MESARSTATRTTSRTVVDGMCNRRTALLGEAETEWTAAHFARFAPQAQDLLTIDWPRASNQQFKSRLGLCRCLQNRNPLCPMRSLSDMRHSCCGSGTRHCRPQSTALLTPLPRLSVALPFSSAQLSCGQWTQRRTGRPVLAPELAVG